MNREEREAAIGEIVNMHLTGGSLGNLPDWYVLLKYAEKLNIPPWEVEAAYRDHPEWFERVEMATKAENRVKERAHRRKSKVHPGLSVPTGNEGVPIPRVDAVSRMKVGT